jgi:hypothetical protein
MQMGLSLPNRRCEQELCPKFVETADKGSSWFRVSILTPFKQACTLPISSLI